MCFARRVLPLIAFKFTGNGRFISAEYFGDLAQAQSHCLERQYLFTFRYVKIFVTHGLTAFFELQNILAENYEFFICCTCIVLSSQAKESRAQS